MYGHLNDIFDSHIVRLDIQVVQKSFPKTEILTIAHNSSSNIFDLCNLQYIFDEVFSFLTFQRKTCSLKVIQVNDLSLKANTNKSL